MKAPRWDGLRPTSDRLRETLFNVLAPRIPSARVLDGYAGTGASGIEALSRGAAAVTFVERDRRARSLIAENLAHCGVASLCVIIRASAPQAFKALVREARSFDVVLLDPPYDVPPAAALAPAAALVAPGGVLVLEHARRQPSPEHTGALGRTRQIVSGDSVLSFYSCLP